MSKLFVHFKMTFFHGENKVENFLNRMRINKLYILILIILIAGILPVPNLSIKLEDLKCYRKLNNLKFSGFFFGMNSGKNNSKKFGKN